MRIVDIPLLPDDAVWVMGTSSSAASPGEADLSRAMMYGYISGEASHLCVITSVK